VTGALHTKIERKATLTQLIISLHRICYADELATTCTDLGGRVWNENFCILDDYYTVVGPVCWKSGCPASARNQCLEVGGTPFKYWCLVKGCDYTGENLFCVLPTAYCVPLVSWILVLQATKLYTFLYTASLILSFFQLLVPLAQNLQVPTLMISALNKRQLKCAMKWVGRYVY
jgi:hypothetical protein